MFQYKVCTRIDLQNPDDEATTQDWLNEQGWENWELVSCIPLGTETEENGFSRNTIRYVFKREIQRS